VPGFFMPPLRGCFTSRCTRFFTDSKKQIPFDFAQGKLSRLRRSE
jgi:hypothetical protein